MKTTREIVEGLRDQLDAAVLEIGKDQYQDVLEELRSEIDARLDCIREENEENNEE